MSKKLDKDNLPQMLYNEKLFYLKESKILWQICKKNEKNETS